LCNERLKYGVHIIIYNDRVQFENKITTLYRQTQIEYNENNRYFDEYQLSLIINSRLKTRAIALVRKRNRRLRATSVKYVRRSFS